MKLPAYQLIRKVNEWQACLEILQAEPSIAIDLEANSMYAYREKICLIQISTPNQDFILDPTIQALDLEPFGELIINPEIQKIFHAAEYDLILLKREFGWELKNLFDTMWAARILGYKRFGLASMLETCFQVKLNKRYQKSNWCQRPLSPEQLVYAQHDTHFLFALRDRLAAELAVAGSEEEAVELFAAQTKIVLPNTDFDPDSFWHMQGVQDLSRKQQAVLKEVNIYRDRAARDRNQPLFKIFGGRTLLEIAKQTPKSMQELRRIHGMTNGQIHRYGQGVLQAVQRGLKAAPPAHPKRNKRLPDDVLARYDILHNWRKQRGLQRGVESDVILSREALWEIAHTNPTCMAELEPLDSIGPWRCATYGPEIIELLTT